jgi:hypothetical protein
VSTITVNSTAKLNAALATAHAGDTIQLAAGTYSGIMIKNFNAGGAVTITSASLSNHAVITDMQVTNSSGLNFSGLEFSFPLAAGAAAFYASPSYHIGDLAPGQTNAGVRVAASNNITFNADSFHGVLNGDSTMDGKGLFFANSSNVTVQNSEFQDLLVGISNVTSTNVTITGNNLHEIRRDGIDNAGSSNVVVSGNTFSDFQHVGDPSTGGEHPDAIQFWTTSTETDHNITVANNVIVQGAGRDMHGIFVRALNGGTYDSVNITGNLIVNGSYEGISVNGGTNIQVTNNTVQAISQMATTPWIQVENVSGAVVTGNSSDKYHLDQNVSGLTQGANVVTKPVSDGGLSLVTSFLSQNTHVIAMGPSTPSALVSHPTAQSYVDLESAAFALADNGGDSDTSTVDSSLTTTSSPPTTSDPVSGPVGSSSGSTPPPADPTPPVSTPPSDPTPTPPVIVAGSADGSAPDPVPSDPTPPVTTPPVTTGPDTTPPVVTPPVTTPPVTTPPVTTPPVITPVSSPTTTQDSDSPLQAYGHSSPIMLDHPVVGLLGVMHLAGEHQVYSMILS